MVTRISAVSPGQEYARMPKRIARIPRSRTTHQCSDIVRTAEKTALGAPLAVARRGRREQTAAAHYPKARTPRRCRIQSQAFHYLIPLLLFRRLPFALALSFQVGAMRALVRLDVLEAARRIANRVEFLAGDAAV